MVHFNIFNHMWSINFQFVFGFVFVVNVISIWWNFFHHSLHRQVSIFLLLSIWSLTAIFPASISLYAFFVPLKMEASRSFAFLWVFFRIVETKRGETPECCCFFQLNWYKYAHRTTKWQIHMVIGQAPKNDTEQINYFLP